MFSRGGFDARTNRGKLPESSEAVDAFVALAGNNPDKVLVMAYIAQLVTDGFAVWKMHDNGEVEVRFTSGETYLLAETTILRLA